MKRNLFLILFIGIVLNATTILSLKAQDYYTRFSVSGGDVIMKDFKKNPNIGGNPYFSKDWVQGTVRTTDNVDYSNDLLFMFDKIEQKLYFKKKDSSVIREADPGKIYSFTLLTDKPHVFMRGAYFSPDYANKFFEVLVLNLDEYSLFKFTNTTLEKPETSQASRALTQTMSDGDYVDNTTYFIYYHKTLQPVEMKKKNFPKAFTENGDKVAAYIKNNNGSFNETYAASLLQEINKEIN